MSDSDGYSSYLAGMSDKNFNDPIHGYISFDNFTMDIIDTPQFQRLRYLKQMGASYFIFPGASHNRFEHCLGVGHLAGNLIRRFKESQPELDITKQDMKCVKIAGLCHDLGSQKMFKYLVDDNNIDLDQDEVSLINDLIIGQPTHHGRRFEEKRFLFDIIANQRNGVDVDKFDYLSRDCYNLGLKNSYDSSRLMIASRVIDDQICYHHKEVYNLYDMFHTRYSLFKRIYTHKVEGAIEHMLVDALVKAEPYLKLTEALHDPERYLYLTDDILRDVERSAIPELAESRELIKRIRSRQLYKFVDEFIIPGELREHLTETTINPVAISTHQEDGANLNPDDIIVHWNKLNYGKNTQNPVDSIRFFNKFNDYQSFTISRESVSYLIPVHFCEFAIRVYTRDVSKANTIQKAFRKLIREWKSKPNSPKIDLVTNHGNDVPIDYESPRKRRLIFPNP
ncbi:hypothetical protein H4R33_003607 [Dimargaris cristalligena]|nr:hypothetical protein H4R33_003607 [Dimargaris cristalligena]